MDAEKRWSRLTATLNNSATEAQRHKRDIKTLPIQFDYVSPFYPASFKKPLAYL